MDIYNNGNRTTKDHSDHLVSTPYSSETDTKNKINSTITEKVRSSVSTSAIDLRTAKTKINHKNEDRLKSEKNVTFSKDYPDEYFTLSIDDMLDEEVDAYWYSDSEINQFMKQYQHENSHAEHQSRQCCPLFFTLKRPHSVSWSQKRIDAAKKSVFDTQNHVKKAQMLPRIGVNTSAIRNKELLLSLRYSACCQESLEIARKKSLSSTIDES